MPKTDFVPTRDSELDPWLGNFETKSASMGSITGYRSGRHCRDACADSNPAGGFSGAAYQTRRGQSRYKSLRTGQEDCHLKGSRRSPAALRRARPTAAPLGAELGIVGAADTSVKTALQKPTLKPSLKGGKIIITFVKRPGRWYPAVQPPGYRKRVYFSGRKNVFALPGQSSQPLCRGSREIRQYPCLLYQTRRIGRRGIGYSGHHGILILTFQIPSLIPSRVSNSRRIREISTLVRRIHGATRQAGTGTVLPRL